MLNDIFSIFDKISANDYFHFEERGKIEIKGKGLMRTWFLLNGE